MITYYQKKRHLFGDLKVNVYGDDGALITSLPGVKRRGMNRVSWPMRLPPPKLPPATSLVPAFLGPALPEGKYRVELVKGKETLEGMVELVADPRSPHSAEARKAQRDFSMDLYNSLADLTYLSESLGTLATDARSRASDLKGGDAKNLNGFADDVEEFLSTIASQNEAGMLSGDEKLREKMGNLYGNVITYEGQPTATQVARKERLDVDLAQAIESGEALAAKTLPGLNKLLERREMPLLERVDRETWSNGPSAGAASGASVKQLSRYLLPEVANRLARGW